MIALLSLFATLLLGSSLAAPASICGIPGVRQISGSLCSRTYNNVLVSTPLGAAEGVADSSGANRFAVRYASAERWAKSSVATTWALPNDATDPAALPLVCPQQGVYDSTFSEDCLSMLLYVPKTFTASTSSPVFVWVHGGSFVEGSATDPGLDGSNLAVATDSIVVVFQYRLGALGLLAPNGSMNLALLDVINALTFINSNIATFGGDNSRVTVAGESSGGTMIRALLAAPSASHLFQSAILQSDPMNYGFLSTTTYQTLQNAYNGLVGCTASDVACQASLSLDTILSAQGTLANEALGLDPSVGIGEPIRTVNDGTLITTPLDSTAPFPSVTKPILVSTVLDEATITIYGELFSSPVPEDEFEGVCDGLLGEPRTTTVVNSSFYPPPAAVNGSVDARVQLQTLGTDYIWRCPTWTFARNWIVNGGSAFVGLYTVGATYPGNEAVSLCTAPGAVCHQDDIEIVFGTVPNPNPAQANLIREVQARYKAFMLTGRPNDPAFVPWMEATSDEVNVLDLGGPGMIAVGACTPSFWGDSVPYDYQVFDS